jgi:hypothetical protein
MLRLQRNEQLNRVVVVHLPVTLAYRRGGRNRFAIHDERRGQAVEP